MTRPPKRRYLGTWTLPSGNSVDVYLDAPESSLHCEWDRPPSPAWPREDLQHWQDVTLPEILRAITTTGQTGIGIAL